MVSHIEEAEDLPTELPLLAVHGAVLLPMAQLPIPVGDFSNVDTMAEILKNSQFLGVVQTMPGADEDDEHMPVYKTGCVGKINDIQEIDEGQFVVIIKGVGRFKILEESFSPKGYRQIKVSYSEYPMDYIEESDFSFDRKRFIEALEKYFKIFEIKPNWAEINNTSNQRLINALTIACPLEATEKQALLEASSPKEQSEIMLSLIEIASRAGHTSVWH